MTTNPVFRILTEDLGMPEDEALSQLENNTLDLDGWGDVTDDILITIAENCAELTSINFNACNNITNAGVMAIAENCEYLEDIKCFYTNVDATGRQLIEDIKTRPRPPPLEKGWWMDDGTGPQCKGMMN